MKGARMNMPQRPIMTLGIAASNSIMNDKGVLSFSGASSERNIAIPRLKGTAMIRARNDDTRVPKIKGRAPNTSATGSHVELVKKPTPKMSLESADPIKSSLNNKNARIIMLKAKKPITASKIKSPESLPRLIRKKDNFARSILNEWLSVVGHKFYGFFIQAYDVVRQRYIEKV